VIYKVFYNQRKYEVPGSPHQVNFVSYNGPIKSRNSPLTNSPRGIFVRLLNKLPYLAQTV
jgi:hypothetical protein